MGRKRGRREMHKENHGLRRKADREGRISKIMLFKIDFRFKYIIVNSKECTRQQKTRSKNLGKFRVEIARRRILEREEQTQFSPKGGNESRFRYRLGYRK